MRSHRLTLLVGATLGAITLVAAPLVSARQNPLESLFGNSLDPEASQRERSALEAAVVKDPSHAEAWQALLAWSYENEESDETVARAKAGIEQVSDPAKLWRVIAQVRQSDARSGPTMLSRPDFSRGRKPRIDTPEEEFARSMQEQALEAWGHVLALAPRDREAQAQKGYTLMSLARWVEADAHWRGVLETEWSADAAAAWAFSHARAGHVQEALTAVEAFIVRAPHDADLHACHARILELTGAPAETSAEAMAQAQFYSRLLPDHTLDYSAAAAQSLDRLLASKTGKPAFFSGDRDAPTIQAEIQALEKRSDGEAIELLAALAWSHTAHGPMEDQVFDFLAEQRQIVVLQRILNHARSSCTAGNALRALVTLKVDVFDTLARLLPQDGGMFPMGIVGMLGDLGDARAGPLLIEYTRHKDAPFFEDALVVLGRFPSEETRRHLESWLKDKDAAPFAAAGLYRFAPDKRLWSLMEKAIKEREVWELGYIEMVIRDTDTPQARKLLERYEARLKKERAKSK